MKNAISLRHSRQIIDSSMADYNSYLSLSLVCPICLQPVYYVKPSTVPQSKRHYKSGKVSTIKEYSKEAYFKHFTEVSKEEEEVCERRAKSLTKERSLTQINAIIRGQRLDAFKNRIDRLFYFNSYLSGMNYILPIAYLDFTLAVEEYLPKIKTDKQRQIYYQKIQRIIYGRLQGEKAKIASKIEVFLKSIVVGREDIHSNLDYLRNPIEFKLHLATCYEIVDFLFAPGNFSYAQKLIQFAFFRSSLLSAWAAQLSERSITSEEKELELTSLKLRMRRYPIFNDAFPDELITRITALKTFSELFSIYDISQSDYLKTYLIVDFFVSAIALTPWADAFAYFDGTLEPKKQNTSVDLNTNVFVFVKREVVLFLGKNDFTNVNLLGFKLSFANRHLWSSNTEHSFELGRIGLLEKLKLTLAFTTKEMESKVSHRAKITLHNEGHLVGEFWACKTLTSGGKGDLLYKNFSQFTKNLSKELIDNVEKCNTLIQIKSTSEEVSEIALSVALKLFHGEV